MKRPIYLDHNANTPVDPRVVEKIHEYLKEMYGNPSSSHRFGKKINHYLTSVRDALAAFLAVRSEEIVFTSGGTEGINLLIRGMFDEDKTGHIVTSNVEHSCVLNTVKCMEKRGVAVTYLSPGVWGAIKPEAVLQAIRPDTRLIALMSVNNETGVKTEIEPIAQMAREKNIPFIVDAIAHLGREELRIYPGISAMAFSGQKIHAPPGVGFCYIKRSLKLSPLFTGGAQQSGRRAGTENLPGIVGLGEAVKILSENQHKFTQKMHGLREHFESKLKERIPDLFINGEGPRSVSTSNLYFKGVDGETLLTLLDMEGIAASHGSSCSSGSLEPSRILVNMGYSLQRVNSSLRFSFSRDTTEEEIHEAVKVISFLVSKLRG